MASRLQQSGAMEQFVTDEMVRFSKALSAYFDFAADVLRKGTTYEGRVLPPHTLELSHMTPVSKYVKLVAWNGTQHSVFGFVRVEDGAILYPASWKKPFIAKGGPMDPKTIRGSVYDPTTWPTCTAWTGVRTIR